MNLPPYTTHPELTAGEYRLRKVVREDVANMLDVLTFNGKQADFEIDGIAIIEKIDQKYDEGDGINWGIEHPESGDIIGCCGFYRGFEGGVGEIGFIIKSSFRRKGIMRDTITAICNYGLTEMGLGSVVAITRSDNRIAQKFLKNSGFAFVQDVEDGMCEYKFQS